MESKNSNILDNIIKKRENCIKSRITQETNERNVLEEVVKSLKQREVELEKEFQGKVQVRFQI